MQSWSLPSRRSRPARGWAAILCVILVGCSGAPAGSGIPGAATSGASTTTASPSAAAPSTSPEDLPLPEPTLGSVEEIVAALDDPAQAEQVVVSMLNLLGIGLYEADGTVIRKGTETSDADFYVFEPVARGLAAMLRERADPDSQISFAAFHAGLAEAGYVGSINELAGAYADAYAAQPDAAISRLVAALGAVNTSATLSAFEVWVLILDGFIPPNGVSTATACAPSCPPAVASGGAGWGVAWRNVQHGGRLPDDFPEIAAQLSALLNSWRLTVTATPVSVHEGHNGAEGSPATLTARLVGPRTALVSPFSGAAIVPAPTGPAGAPMGWVEGPAAERHGSVTDAATAVDANGEATTTYVPKVEEADGKGIDREEQGVIHAGVQRRELAFALYGTFVTPYAMFMESHIRNQVVLNLDWHEKAEAVIKIVWTDTYDGVADIITFFGDLTDVEGDPANGGLYTGTGTASGSRAGWVGCNPGIDLVPSGTVDATFNAVLTGNGTIVISAYADAFTALGGISTAPMEVLVTGGHAVYDSEVVGELCPHSSHGEMTVTGLVLP